MSTSPRIGFYKSENIGSPPVRSMALNWEKAFSIGLKSELYGKREGRVASTASNRLCKATRWKNN